MVYILLGHGFEEIEAVAPGDILRRGGVEVSYVGVGGKSIYGARSVGIRADEDINSCEFADMEMLVLPGGDVDRDGNYGSSAAAQLLIRSVREAGIPIAAICAGPSVLARLGLLKGLRCTCYPGIEDTLGDAVYVPDKKVVADSGIITGQGPGAAVEFALNLLALLRGVSVAREVEAALFCPEVSYDAVSES